MSSQRRDVAECPLDALDHFAISHRRLVEDDEDGRSDEVCLSRVSPDVARARLLNGDWHFEGNVGCPRDIELLSSNSGGGDGYDDLVVSTDVHKLLPSSLGTVDEEDILRTATFYGRHDGVEDMMLGCCLSSATLCSPFAASSCEMNAVNSWTMAGGRSCWRNREKLS